jgi:hypothetical protein
MFERLSRSWALIGASASLLQQDRKLLLFPLISMFSLLLVLISFAIPVFLTMGLSDTLERLANNDVSRRCYLVVFLFYLTQYFIIFFFNVALVSCSMTRLDGGTPSVREGLRVALSKAHVILGYAFIAATVGMILRAVEERVGFIGRFIVMLIGAAWSMATYLVVPVLVVNEVGPLRAIEVSTELLKRTWGESVIGQFGIGIGFVLIYIGIFAGGALVVCGAVLTHSPVVIALAVLALAITLIFAVLVHSALSGIYAAVLYRYATTGECAPGFNSLVLQGAFAPKSGA